MNVPAPCYVILADPGGKRWESYFRDLVRFWRRRELEPDVALIPWSDVVPRIGRIDELLPHRRPALFRLESPGRGGDIRDRFIRVGRGEESSPDAVSPSAGPTALESPGLVFRGLCRTLGGLRDFLDHHSQLKPLACPLAVAEMFDKEATCRRLTAAGLPCPASIHAPGTSAELLDELRARRLKTAYVKLRAGSNASGIAVVHALDDPPWAITSMVRIGDEFHNTRRLQKVSGAQLGQVLDFLLREGAIIQEGIPLARIDGQNFDVRAVVIHGQVAFTIFRLSDLPMTNLHLGGRRGAWQACRAQVPTRAWLDALDHCAEAARLYTCSSVGVDVVFERGFARHFLLEVNAFGDFFPHLTDAAGRTVHEVEIELTARHFGLID